jgi:KDO2-lipid IV(A) lauroyltransferase
MKHILRNPNDGNSAYMFVADQTPHISMVNFGLKFLNQKTPAFIGYDRLSSRMNVTFVYCEMEKVKEDITRLLTTKFYQTMINLNHTKW